MHCLVNAWIGFTPLHPVSSYVSSDVLDAVEKMLFDRSEFEHLLTNSWFIYYAIDYMESTVSCSYLKSYSFLRKHLQSKGDGQFVAPGGRLQIKRGTGEAVVWQI